MRRNIQYFASFQNSLKGQSVAGFFQPVSFILRHLWFVHQIDVTKVEHGVSEHGIPSRRNDAKLRAFFWRTQNIALCPNDHRNHVSACVEVCRGSDSSLSKPTLNSLLSVRIEDEKRLSWRGKRWQIFTNERPILLGHPSLFFVNTCLPVKVRLVWAKTSRICVLGVSSPLFICPVVIPCGCKSIRFDIPGIIIEKGKEVVN
mmetsp:Transcript_2868/g.6747  ORF Transcript_2868/g.6747 Transcript_2868/m.6747 type:complete len:202 (-) Transcript_2868:1070-1675(-)